MLIETTFRLGGSILVALGAALAAGYVAVGVGLADLQLFLAPALFFLLGGIFLYAGVDARRARLALLELGETGGAPSSLPRPKR